MHEVFLNTRLVVDTIHAKVFQHFNINESQKLAHLLQQTNGI